MVGLTDTFELHFLNIPGIYFEGLHVVSKGTASDIGIQAEQFAYLRTTMAELTAANRSSMLQDVRKGRPTEIDWINGEVARRGRGHHVPTPVNDALLQLVEVLEAYP